MRWWCCGSSMGLRECNDGFCEQAMRMWKVRWWTIHGVGVESTVPKQPKHLRRHNSQHKQNWVKLGWRKCEVGKTMRKLCWWWWLMKKQPSLSSLDTLVVLNHSSSNHKCDGEQDWLGCGSQWWCSGMMWWKPQEKMPKFTKFDGVKRCWWYFCGKGDVKSFKMS